MQKIGIKLLDKEAKVPTYGTDEAACFDIYALEGGEIPLGGSKVFRTGIALNIPKGYVLEVYSRSGHGFKNNVRLSNCTGIIDSDYTQELMIKLKDDNQPERVTSVYNPLMPFGTIETSVSNGSHYNVQKGERIAQGKLVPVERVQFEVVEEIEQRGNRSGGLGSTGKL